MCNYNIGIPGMPNKVNKVVPIKDTHSCPHIELCQQMITENAFYCCCGEIEDFSFKDCFKYKDLVNNHEQGEKRIPNGWDKELDPNE